MSKNEELLYINNNTYILNNGERVYGKLRLYENKLTFCAEDNNFKKNDIILDLEEVVLLLIEEISTKYGNGYIGCIKLIFTQDIYIFYPCARNENLIKILINHIKKQIKDIQKKKAKTISAKGDSKNLDNFKKNDEKIYKKALNLVNEHKYKQALWYYDVLIRDYPNFNFLKIEKNGILQQLQCKEQAIDNITTKSVELKDKKENNETIKIEEYPNCKTEIYDKLKEITQNIQDDIPEMLPYYQDKYKQIKEFEAKGMYHAIFWDYIGLIKAYPQCIKFRKELILAYLSGNRHNDAEKELTILETILKRPIIEESTATKKEVVTETKSVQTEKINISSCSADDLLSLDCLTEEKVNKFVKDRNNGKMWYNMESFADYFDLQPHERVLIADRLLFPLKPNSKVGRKVDF